MKTLVPVVLTALLVSAGAVAEPATLSSGTRRLEIPHLVVDGRVALSDVELMIVDDRSGHFEVVDYAFNPLPDNVIRERELAFGESVSLKPGQELRFIAVLAESRCPGDVVCIHAGEVTVILRITETLISGNTARTDFGLTHLGTAVSTFEHDGIYYRLAAVEPYPVSTEQIPEEDYVITLQYRSVPFRLDR